MLLIKLAVELLRNHHHHFFSTFQQQQYFFNLMTVETFSSFYFVTTNGFKCIIQVKTNKSQSTQGKTVQKRTGSSLYVSVTVHLPHTLVLLPVTDLQVEGDLFYLQTQWIRVCFVFMRILYTPIDKATPSIDYFFLLGKPTASVNFILLVFFGALCKKKR